MNTDKIFYVFILTFFVIPNLEAQTKKIKRPKSPVGVQSVDNFVRESFDLYDKVYMYDGYAKSGTPLDDSAIDVLEDALDDLTILSESTPYIISDLEGVSVLKKAKATLQINKAKKALTYSIKTVKELLSKNKKGDDETDDDDSSVSSSDDEDGDDEKIESDTSEENISNSNMSDDLEIYSKFDFVPGDKLLFFDDFSQEFIGDFPSQWNTNGSGEVVKVNKADGNWFEIKAGYFIYYIPLLDTPLPEEYTIEFDILANGIDRQTSSTATLTIYLDDNDSFKIGANMAQASIPFCQYSPIGIEIQNKKDNSREIYSKVTADIRKEILNQPHISIAVNKKRFRLWVNQKKYVDVPQLIPENKLKYMKFSLNTFVDGKEEAFLRNLKIAEGGLDLRRRLMSEGKVSTNGILFDSGSANIKPQSYGIIRQISQVLLQDDKINLNIIGHTDADGNDDTNLKLSKSRAEAVKIALIKIYKISEDRLQFEGKGEYEPVGDNNTAEGKSQNRRVDFVKM